MLRVSIFHEDLNTLFLKKRLSCFHDDYAI